MTFGCVDGKEHSALCGADFTFKRQDVKGDMKTAKRKYGETGVYVQDAIMSLIVSSMHEVDSLQ